MNKVHEFSNHDWVCEKCGATEFTTKYGDCYYHDGYGEVEVCNGCGEMIVLEL